MTESVYFLITDAGGGHRACANALSKAFNNFEYSTNVKIVNIYQEIIHECDLLQRWFKFPSENVYNSFIMGNSFYWMAKPACYLVKFLRKIFKHKIQSIFENYWLENKPKMIISFAPYLNKLIHESLKKHAATIPFIVILTDPEEWTKNLWFGSSDSFYFCPTKTAFEQALAFGIPQQKLIQMSGIILNSDFYIHHNIEKQRKLAALGLSPNAATGLISSGKVSSKRIFQNILKKLSLLNLDFQLIILCGNNEKLYNYLQSIPTPFKKYVSGWTNDIPTYTAISDFFIGKPGSGSINEALLMRLPVITEYNFFTMPQEKSVARFIIDNQYGICVRSFSKIANAVKKLLENYSFFKQNVMGYHNNAIFEASKAIENLIRNNQLMEKD